MMNGLGQAVATHLAAAKGNDSDPHRHLYDDLQAWLCGNAQLPGLPYAGRSDLIREITLHDEAAYLMAQAEALAYCGWLKRFAVAYLKNPDTPGEAE
jgi:CRISPR-associated protein Cmr5